MHTCPLSNQFILRRFGVDTEKKMDAKITKKRLSGMLSYDWLKIVGAAALLIFAWVLTFTMTATRVKPSQQFIIINYTGNVSLSDDFDNALDKALESGAFSHEVLEAETVDMTISEDAAYQLLDARIATKELDLIFVSQEGDASTVYEATAEDGSKYTTHKQTYLQSFAYSRWHVLHDVNGYLAQMQSFLQGYYTDYNDPATLNKEKVEKDFRTRIANNKDKRYKKEAQILAALEGEYNRMEQYRKAYFSFQDYLAKGYVELVPLTYTDEEAGTVFENKSFAINICPTGAPQMEKLSRLVGYKKSYADENGTPQTTISAENMCVCLFNFAQDEEVYRYEGLLYITNLLDTVTA